MLSSAEELFVSTQSWGFDRQHDNHDGEEQEKIKVEVDVKHGDGHWSVDRVVGTSTFQWITCLFPALTVFWVGL